MSKAGHICPIPRQGLEFLSLEILCNNNTGTAYNITQYKKCLTMAMKYQRFTTENTFYPESHISVAQVQMYHASENLLLNAWNWEISGKD